MSQMKFKKKKFYNKIVKETSCLKNKFLETSQRITCLEAT